jgi:hypothetical protein
LASLAYQLRDVNLKKDKWTIHSGADMPGIHFSNAAFVGHSLASEGEQNFNQSYTVLKISANELFIKKKMQKRMLRRQQDLNLCGQSPCDF